LERKQRNLGNLKKSFADTSRELLAFVRIAEGIKLNFWGNGKLSGNKKKMLEENMWFEKAKFMMAVDLMTIGNVSKPTLEMVYAMPKKIRGELMSNLSENDLLKNGNRIDDETKEFLIKIRKEKKRYEKIKPISSCFVRAMRILG
jgi:hypothetical protein